MKAFVPSTHNRWRAIGKSSTHLIFPVVFVVATRAFLAARRQLLELNFASFPAKLSLTRKSTNIILLTEPDEY